MISGFRSDANETCALLRFNAAQQGGSVPMSWTAYWSHLRGPSLTFVDGNDTFPKTPVRNYLPALH